MMSVYINNSVYLLSLLFVISWDSVCQANLLEYGLQTADDGLVTLDTDTNLEWLDLTATQNQSFQTVLNSFGGYTTTHGFRVATKEEVGRLFINAGVPDGSLSPVNINGVTLLFLMLGVLVEDAHTIDKSRSEYQSHGMSMSGAYPGFSTFYLIYRDDIPVSGRTYLHNGGTNKTAAFDYSGTFLVRPASSPFEPASPQPTVLRPPLRSSATPPTSVASVPTLSTWGLIILCVIILLVSPMYTKQDGE